MSRLLSGSPPRSKRSCARYSSIMPGFVALEGTIPDGKPSGQVWPGRPSLHGDHWGDRHRGRLSRNWVR